jgi:hypothetical protein
MTDDLEQRLRDADPMSSASRRAGPQQDWIPQLVASTVKEPHDGRDHSAPRRWIAVGAAAAAAVVAIAVGGFAVLGGGGDDPATTTAAKPSTMRLSLPAPDAAAMCIVFSTEILADMPVAFSGTAIDVGDESVLLEVDRWYRGGDQDQVRLSAPSSDAILLEGTVAFAAGQRYLVTATDGVVNSCGYTADWTPEMAAAFADAFGG